MMKLEVEGKLIPIISAHQDQVFYENSTRPCLTFGLPTQGISSEQLEALRAGTINIYDGDNVLAGTYENYNHVAAFSLTLVQVQPSELTISNLQRQILELEASIESRVEKAREEMRRQIVDIQTQKVSDVEKAVSEEKTRASAEVAKLERAHREKIEELKKSLEMEVEDAELTAREARVLTKPTEEEEWDPTRRYLAGDLIKGGYQALRFSRGKNPEEHLGTYWVKLVHVDVQDWSIYPRRHAFRDGDRVLHGGKTWLCMFSHLKSDFFEPKENSSKWELDM